MARTLKTSGFNLVSVSKCMWCCIVLLLLSLLFCVDGVQANSSNSSGVVSSDGQTGETESTVEKGMRPFFDMVMSFLGVVQPNKLTEQTWLNFSNIIRDGQFQTDQFTTWQNWAKYLVGFIVCAAVGVVFFIAMPIIGLVFCCCRCCGKCGGRPKPHDPKHASCKRKTYCTLLIVFNTMALAGVVCVFMSNQILYDKLRNENNAGPIGKLFYSVDEVSRFTNTTIDDVNVYVLDKFIDGSAALIKDIADTANDAIDDVLETLNATSLLNQLEVVSSDVDKTQQELSNVATQLGILSSLGSMLADNLTQIRDQIDAACTPGPCPGYDPSMYTTSANFSGLSTVTTEINNVAKSANISQYIKESEDAINTTKATATASVDTAIQNATTSVDRVKQEIEKGVNKFASEVTQAITVELNEFHASLADAEDDISKYSQYVWYGGIALSCVLLLVVVVYYIGILFGLCGERPGYGAQCCNTGMGANFLMGGVGITFLLGWLIMLVCIILFVTGGPIYTELCRYFSDHQPQTLKPFNDAVMNAVDFQKSLFNGRDVRLDLVDILEGCENDSAIYSVLHLENMVNISQYTDLSALRIALFILKQDNLNTPVINILSGDLNQSVTNFANSGVDSIPFQSYYDEVNKNLTAGELPVMADQLRSLAQDTTIPEQTRQTLNSSAAALASLQENQVVPMKQAEKSLNDSLTYLQTNSDIKASTNALLDGLQRAQDNFNSQKDVIVKNQLSTVIDSVLTRAEDTIHGIMTSLNEDVGRCRPVYNSFYSAVDSVCVAGLEPYNGLWFGIGWCLFFFVPALIFAVKLAGLYRREHDARDFDDPNFNLYEEGKQDGIPLTSRQQPGPSPSRQDHGRGMANYGYQEDMGPMDYPGYKGGAINSGYQPDNYPPHMDRRAPPPYGSHSDGSAAMNGNHRVKDQRMYPY